MNRWQKIKFALAVLLVSVMLHPNALLACAACYGQSDSPLAQGMNWGIYSLLAVIGCVLSVITAFFVHLGRRAANTTRATEADETTAKKS
jgi:hypothetical protein